MAELARTQFNRVSHEQLLELGLSQRTVTRWLDSGRLVAVHEAVYALAPVLDHDTWGRWMAATLTAGGTVLSFRSAAAAYGFWSLPREIETVTRRGSGGPRRLDGLLVYRSLTVASDSAKLHRIPLTSVPRTLLDLATVTGPQALARALREAVRLELTTLPSLHQRLSRYRGRRGVGRLREAITRYAGLPLERARSGAEIRALEILRAAGLPLPRLNVRIAGEEADLSWVRPRVIVEIDGGPFHLDAGEDARKQAIWENAGWVVRRLSSDDIYERPERLLDLARRSNVRE